MVEQHVVGEQIEGKRTSTASERACHPAAAIFPLLEGAALKMLLDDVKEHGVREPGWLDHAGRILDGRNRG